MSTSSSLGQAIRLAFGAWVSFAILILFDALRGGEVELRGVTYNENMLMFYLIACTVVAAICALPFFAWLVFRSRHSEGGLGTPWPIPLIAGLLFPLLLFGMIDSLVGIGAPNRVIGIMMLIGFFGLPIGFADICWRFARPVGLTEAQLSKSKPESFDFFDSG